MLKILSYAYQYQDGYMNEIVYSHEKERSTTTQKKMILTNITLSKEARHQNTECAYKSQIQECTVQETKLTHAIKSLNNSYLQGVEGGKLLEGSIKGTSDMLKTFWFLIWVLITQGFSVYENYQAVSYDSCTFL